MSEGVLGKLPDREQRGSHSQDQEFGACCLELQYADRYYLGGVE
jgi:hypothetical protein